MVNSIVEALSAHAHGQPERLAIRFEGEEITYGQLRERIERFAQALVKWGVRAGDRIALFLGNDPDFVVAYLGAQLAGGIVVLVNTQYRQVELSHIMTDAAVRLCVTDGAGAQELLRLAPPDLEALVVVGEPGGSSEPGEQRIQLFAFAEIVAQAGDAASSSLAMPAGDAPAVIGYTSGTTGRAKGALLLHRNLIANVTAVTTAW